ncbi:MAG: HEPN domain-containing protein [Chitinivibrionia bacterium]|nr:HEPN domain-containing protein [Chitinivibrionia bacterium]
MNEILLKEWVRHSTNDLITARHLFFEFHPKQTEISCYHCQQCAEKALKSYIVFKEEEPEKTHNLVSLCQKCMSFDTTFSEISDNCAELLPFATAVRYPVELSPDDYIAKQAIDNAQKVFDFCIQKIKESGISFPQLS